MRFFALVFLAALALVTVGLAAPADDFDGVVRLGGSSTLLPVVADCANAFMEHHKTWDKVDPSFPRKEIVIFVTGGGSGFGAQATINGAVDIGLMTRGLKDEEKQRIGEHEQHLVSSDCLAAVTNKEGPLAGRGNLSRDDAARILTGEAKTWKDIDAALPETPIVVLLRDMTGSANELIQKDVLKGKTFTASALQLPSMGAILKRVEENPNAFAFLTSGMAHASDKLAVHSYEGVLPTNDNVVAGKYSLVRPMFLVVKGKATTYEKAFIDFVLGDGQKIIEAHGYVPARPVASH